MKICMISNLYPPFIMGGAEIVVENTANELVKRGHQVFVITSSQENKVTIDEIDGVNVYRIPNLNVSTPYNFSSNIFVTKVVYYILNLWSPRAYTKVSRILHDEMPNLVHVHNYKGISLSIFHAIKTIKIPVIFTAHDHFLICPYNSLLKRSGAICSNPKLVCKMYSNVQRLFINRCVDVVISPSAFLINNLRRNNFFLTIPTYVIPLGIEKSPHNNIKDYRNITLLFVGSLGKAKGVDILINAFKKISDPNLHLDIVGKGPMEQELRTLSYSDNRITFHGFISPKEIDRFYQKANLVIVPSICYDNSPMVIYESFVNGTPVVGSKIGGIPELIKDGNNGYTFTPGDTDQLVLILKELITNPAKLKEMESNSYESSKLYSIKKYIDSLESIYIKVISK